MNVEVEILRKRKPKLRWWWFTGIPILVIGLIAVQAFGPNPPLQLGPQTTVITEPLGNRGTPDYVRYLVEKSSAGVTSESNAAVRYWQAMWPGDLDRAQQEALLKRLEMPDPLLANKILEVPTDDLLCGEVAKWLESFRSEDRQDASDAIAEARDLLFQALYRPWESLPALDAWATRNQQPLELLLAGSRRPHYFSPPPNYQTGEETSMFALLLTDVQMLRQASDGLRLNAMVHLHHQRYEEAWENLLASYRMARHIASRHGFLIHVLVSIRLDESTDQTLQSLLSCPLGDELLTRITADLAALPPTLAVSEALDESERLGCLDTLTRLSLGGRSMESVLEGTETHSLRVGSQVRIDWNVALRKANVLYDRLVQVADLPFAQREAAWDELETELFGFDPRQEPLRFVHGIVSTRARTELVSDMFLSLMTPAIDRVMAAGDRKKTRDVLRRVAVALARHRAATQSYPNDLQRLVPRFLSEVPVDLYSNQPLRYRVRGDGYLLYSVFENTADDGGTDVDGHIVRGHYRDSEEQYDAKATDLVVRIPVPPLRMVFDAKDDGSE